MENEKQRLSCIDGLKGIGAFIVAFVWHYQHFEPQTGSPFYTIFTLSYSFGWSMVDLFFLLSGFGMMLGYGDRVLNKGISFKDYFLKRLRRLYPLFIFSTAVVLILEVVYKAKMGETFVYGNLDVYHVIQNVLCLQNGILGTEYSLNAPSWCITICLACYCLMFLVLYLSKTRTCAFYVFCCTAVLGASLVAADLQLPILNSQMGRGITCFSIGVILYFVYVNREKFHSLKLGYVSLIFLVVIYLVLRFLSIDYLGNPTLAMDLGIAPMMLMSALLIPWLNRIIGNPVLRFLGKISWDVYLFHFPVQCAIKIVDVYMGLGIDYSKKPVWILYVAITIVFAALYHFLLEDRIDHFVCTFFRKREK